MGVNAEKYTISDSLGIERTKKTTRMSTNHKILKDITRTPTKKMIKIFPPKNPTQMKEIERTTALLFLQTSSD